MPLKEWVHRLDNWVNKTEAQRFHSLANVVMLGLGFELINDPTETVGPYSASCAVYKSSAGLYLSVSFDPIDGSCAHVSCGRLWASNTKAWRCLSGPMSVLASKFGVETPLLYKLHEGAMEQMLQDIQRSIPVILERATPTILGEVEGAKYGAAEHAKIFGSNYLDIVEISDFPDRK